MPQHNPTDKLDSSLNGRTLDVWLPAAPSKHVRPTKSSWLCCLLPASSLCIYYCWYITLPIIIIAVALLTGFFRYTALALLLHPFSLSDSLTSPTHSTHNHGHIKSPKSRLYCLCKRRNMTYLIGIEMRDFLLIHNTSFFISTMCVSV